MEQLPLFLSLRGDRPVLVLGDGEAADAKRRLVEEAGGRVVADEGAAAGARIAFVAMDDGAAAVAARLRAAGLLVNVVDQPALCDFTVPAIIDRDPLLVAIGTGGASASLAKSLKERLELLLPAGLGGLADAIRAARDAVALRYRTVAARRAFWAAALAPGGPMDPLVPHSDPAAAVAAAVDSIRPQPPAPATIRIGPDGADGLTLRQLRQLAAADLLVVDTGVPTEVLALARRDAARVAGADLPADSVGRVVLLRMDDPGMEGDPTP